MSTLLLALVGIVLLIGGAELLVRGASRLARFAGISPLVIGLTIVAVGTSSPEIAVTVISSLNGQADLAVGNVVGSNLCNILLIGGLCAFILPLAVGRTLVWFHVPIMIATSALALWLSADGRIELHEGLLLLGLFAVYVFGSIKVEKHAADPANAGTEVTQHAVTTWGALKQIALIVAGLGGLLMGSHWIVKGAVELATLLGVSQVVIGLTIVAVGTSLPEIATSLMATLRGEREIAIGNIVGSNIANVLCVLGAGCLASGSQGLTVSSSMLHFDFPLMIAVSAICLPIFWSRFEISRLEGALLLGGYALYLVQVVGAATGAWWAGQLIYGIFGYVLLFGSLTLLGALFGRKAAC